MDAHRLRQPVSASDFSEEASLLLHEARLISEKMMGRMKALQEHFPEALLPGQVESLERLRHQEAQERRRDLRWPVTKLQVEARSADTFGPTVTGRLVDRSLTGVGIWLTQPAVVGTRLFLWAGEGRDVEPSLIEVRRCEATDRGWLLGCETLGDPLRL